MMKAIGLLVLFLGLAGLSVYADKPPPKASCDWHTQNCRKCCKKMWGECLPTDGNGWGTDPHGKCRTCVSDCLPRECEGKAEYGNCRM